MVEQYNQAQVRLQQTQAKLLDAKQAKDAADAITARATSELSKRAVAAYTGMGSQLDVLLGAASFTEFSDRLQFMGALAQDDADLAAQAADREPEVAVGGAAVRPGRDGAPDHAERAREPEEPDRGRHLRPGGPVLADEHQLQERARRAGGGRGRGRRGKLLVRVVRIGRGQRVRSSAERERRAGRHRRGGIRDRDDLRVRLGGSGRRLRLFGIGDVVATRRPESRSRTPPR